MHAREWEIVYSLKKRRKGCLTGPATLDALVLLERTQAFGGVTLFDRTGRLEATNATLSGAGILLLTQEFLRWGTDCQKGQKGIICVLVSVFSGSWCRERLRLPPRHWKIGFPGCWDDGPRRHHTMLFQKLLIWEYGKSVNTDITVGLSNGKDA